MRERKWQVCVAVVPVSVLALIFLGCAKEPVTLRAMVPGSVGSSGIGIGDSTGGARNGGAGQDGMSGSARGNAGHLSGSIGQGRGDGDWNGADANGAGGQAGRRRGQAGGAGDAGSGAGAGSLGGAAGAGDAGGAAVGANAVQSGTNLAATRPEPREFTPVAELRDIHFDFDKYDLRPEDSTMLAANAEWLRTHPRDLILIEGHCDDRGTNEYNLALGHHRAESTLKYLVSQGVQANRITVISLGEERPLCTEDSEGCWAMNRRAHFLVRRR